MDHEGGDAENLSVVWVLSWRIFLSISIPIFDLGGLLRLRRWLEPIHQSLVGAHTPSTLVYIKQMQSVFRLSMSSTIPSRPIPQSNG
jgi:hypothetical protein